MPNTRILTIAGMAGSFRLGFRDLVNQNQTYTAKCSGKITVERGLSGSHYSVTSSADDFRVEIEMVVPSDLKDPVHSDDCTAYGWWKLEGFEKVEFSPGDKTLKAEDAADKGAKRKP